MSGYVEMPISDLFRPVSGNPKFIQRYIESHPGKYPVFSGSLFRPFGHVDEHDFDGEYLSWTMNGYAGHVSEIRGKFSLTRDRGLFVPRENVEVPDLTYLRLIMEPLLREAAVGRRIDGKRNTYTKIYPEAAGEIMIRLPINSRGKLDYKLMSELGDRFRRVDLARSRVKAVLDSLRRSAVVIGLPKSASQTLYLGGDWMEYITAKTGWTKATYSKLNTGDKADTPVYSAAREMVAYVDGKHRNKILASPDEPVISFGANGDGSAGTNFVFHERPFYISNDRTAIRVLDPEILPQFIYFSLRGMKERYGFGHTLKANPSNLSIVAIDVPAVDGRFDVLEQQRMLEVVREADRSKRAAEEQLDRICTAKLNILPQDA